MDLSNVASEPPEVRDDLVPFLDEELNRLPHRYRAALVACELEGKSRREAAQQLAIPEGTLSTHLARGRKLLRDRLNRRGITLGVGPVTGLSGRLAETTVSERLMDVTVRAAVEHGAGIGTVGAASKAVSSLADRVLKMMFLTRLTLIAAAPDRGGRRDGRGCRTGFSHAGRARNPRRPIRRSRVRTTCLAGSSTRPAPGWQKFRSGPSAAFGTNPRRSRRRRPTAREASSYQTPRLIKPGNLVFSATDWGCSPARGIAGPAGWEDSGATARMASGSKSSSGRSTTSPVA